MKNSNRITAGIMALMLVFGAGTTMVHTKFSTPESVVATSVETLTSGAFSYKVLEDDTITITDFDNSVTEVQIPSEIDGKPVTAIGDRAFYKSEIISVNIPDSVKSIGDTVFYECKSLESVSIPDGVVSIGVNAFAYCKSLSSVFIPDSVNTMGRSCFSNCTSLKSARLSENLTELSESAFSNCSLLSEIVIPDKVQNIYSQAFKGCTNLKSVSLGSNLQKIHDNVFWDCIALTSVAIPENVTYMGFSVFYNCKSLKEVKIMNPVCDVRGIPETATIYGYEGSTAQEYAEKNNITFKLIGSETKKGDINGDGLIDAVDATWILRYYAHLSTGGTMSLDEFLLSE